MKKMNKKGFTLAELLIVVAIIAVLVAIAIPVFSAQLEKSRQATDLANLRSSYAEAIASYLTSNSDQTGTYYKMQNKNNKLDQIDLSGLQGDLSSVITSSATITGGKEYAVQVTATDTAPYYTISLVSK